ncbi:ABC transporter permease [Streptomyces sp. NPDC004752]
MKLLRLLCATFSLSLRRVLAHRVNLAFDLGQSVIGIVTALVTTLAVFQQTHRLAGWSKPEALVLVGMFAIVSGIRAAFIDPSLMTFVSTIRDGTLDEALLRPAPSWFTTTCRDHAPLALGQSLLGAGIVAVGIGGLPTRPGLVAVVVAVVLTCCAIAIAWALSLAIACLGFWAGRFELSPLMASLWDIGRNPAEVYRQPLRSVVTYLIPLAGMITLPAAALKGTSPGTTLATGLALTAGFVLFAIGLFQQGLKRYTGATS